MAVPAVPVAPALYEAWRTAGHAEQAMEGDGRQAVRHTNHPQGPEGGAETGQREIRWKGSVAIIPRSQGLASDYSAANYKHMQYIAVGGT